jgi:hypothetical protein
MKAKYDKSVQRRLKFKYRDCQKHRLVSLAKVRGGDEAYTKEKENQIASDEGRKDPKISPAIVVLEA